MSVYIPVRDDIIDHRLAEYINNYPDKKKLKIIFIRKSNGVYQFGDKNVCVNLENGKLLVRIGGGFLSIDEFLDQYTPSELNRLARKSQLNKTTESAKLTFTARGKR